MKNGSTKRVLTAFMLTMFLPVALRAQTYRVKTLNGFGGAAGANSINNRGQILGQANNETNTISHAALWTAASPTPFDLGSLGGANTNSTTAFPVKNNRGLIVGISDTNEDNPLGEAFSRSLNDVSVTGSPYLLIAGDVNAGGEIGFTGDGLAFLATPVGSNTAGKSNATQPVYGELPANVRRFLMRWGIEE